jgi:hypothetical protein
LFAVANFEALALVNQAKVPSDNASRIKPARSLADFLKLEFTRTKHRRSDLTVDWEANWRVKPKSQGSWVSRYFFKHCAQGTPQRSESQ